MKKCIGLQVGIMIILFIQGCSTVSVLDSWKADNVNTIKEKRLLVIARTNNKEARAQFETEITRQLRNEGLSATESFKSLPELDPNQKITKEKAKQIKEKLKAAGYNGVVLSVVKDKQKTTRTTTEGGHNAGGNYYGYYPKYYNGFYGFYTHPHSYVSSGVYVPESSTTLTAYTFVLETVAYNLDEPEEKQLVAVVTSKIEDPENAHTAAKEYAKKIIKSLK